jgi:membrane protein implicated in regulation of membrane protease activity
MTLDSVVNHRLYRVLLSSSGELHMSNRAKWSLSLGVLACAACCAVPLTGLLGIGGAAGAVSGFLTGVNLETVLCLTIVGAALTAMLFWWLRRSARKSTECNC